jgi:hypothetical protein
METKEHLFFSAVSQPELETSAGAGNKFSFFIGLASLLGV